MQKAIISIVYHSSKGHTEQVARVLAEQLNTPYTVARLFSVEETDRHFETLHQSDTIVFGSPTYFGNVSAAFKQFMEKTAVFLYRQLWKNKLAAAFTVSATSGGDKLQTLFSLHLFASQHSMNWISLGILPRFLNDQQTDGQNRLASYTGLMTQSDNGTSSCQALHPGDRLTTELFARRIVEVTLLYKRNHLAPGADESIFGTNP